MKSERKVVMNLKSQMSCSIMEKDLKNLLLTKYLRAGM